jgi:4-amino-4-deoxy-L-arabinose transferase-like glycosyltransferase
MLRERKLIVVLFLVALALRLAWVLSLDRHGLPLNDTLFYHHSATALLDGHGYVKIDGVATAQWPPGYSALLAATYWVFGATPMRGAILNTVLGAATVPLLYVLVRHQFGRRVGLIAASILCVMPGPILWTEQLVTETLITLLFVGFFALAVRSRPTWGWATGLGAFVGLATLVRGEAPVWILVPLVLWWASSGWKVALGRIGAVVAAMCVLLVPWTMRNSQVFDSFVPVSLNSSWTMYAGHNPRADGIQNYPSKAMEAALGQGATGPKQELLEANRIRHVAIQWAVDHPGRELELIPRKIGGFLRGDSYAFDWINQSPYQVLKYSDVWFFGTVADAAWFSLLGLCLIGVVGLGRRAWRTPLMLGITTSFVTALVLYGFINYGNYRYHVPYEPLMMVVAALVLERGWQGLRAARATDAAPVTEVDEALDPDADLEASVEPASTDE